MFVWPRFRWLSGCVAGRSGVMRLGRPWRGRSGASRALLREPCLDQREKGIIIVV